MSEIDTKELRRLLAEGSAVDLIAAAVNALPGLLDEVERLKKHELDVAHACGVVYEADYASAPGPRDSVLEAIRKGAQSLMDDIDRDVELETLRSVQATLDRKLERLRAERRWRPIETAPTGPCLVWCAMDDGGEAAVLSRNEKGEWIHEGEPTYCHSYYFEPTHWMPLPKVPNAD